MDYSDHYSGSCRDYYRDPFPHALLSTRESNSVLAWCCSLLLWQEQYLPTLLLMWEPVVWVAYLSFYCRGLNIDNMMVPYSLPQMDLEMILVIIEAPVVCGCL